MRAWADSIAASGYLVVVPKLLTPCMDGGTDGDALSPDSKFDMEWIKQFPWPTQKPKVDAALAFLRSKGATKIGVIGVLMTIDRCPPLLPHSLRQPLAPPRAMPDQMARGACEDRLLLRRPSGLLGLE